ncbi:CHAP domain-containing protein [Candidatus Nitrospira bockiana]
MLEVRARLLIVPLLIVVLGGCASEPLASRHTIRTRACCSAGPAAPHPEAIVRTAAGLVGARTIAVDGRRVTYDCAGVTRAIYLAHGIDLYEGEAHDPGANGVRLIYDHVRAHGRLHRGPAVRRGDLVFFDDTWDFNGDGLVNDPLTHVGVVERVESDGTIVFISRVSGAVERYRMNLASPHVHRSQDGRVLNDYMRRKRRNDPEGTRYLTGQLFATFGTRLLP